MSFFWLALRYKLMERKLQDICCVSMLVFFFCCCRRRLVHPNARFPTPTSLVSSFENNSKAYSVQQDTFEQYSGGMNR